MTKTLTTTAALLLTTTAVSAGGLDRSGNSYSVLFEDGNYLELSFSSVRPEVSGDYSAFLGAQGGSATTGNMAQDYSNYGLAMKYDVTDQIAVGLFLNQPYGANADYPNGFYTGLGANWESEQVAAVLKYQATPNVSVFGGVRSVVTEADIAIPDSLIRLGLQNAALGGNAQAAAIVGAAPAGTLAYDAETNSDRQNSFIVGAAYEMPEIALRVGLTYESGYTHEFEATEVIPAVAAVSGVSTFEIEMPQAVTLDFQSGVAEDTLVFGSVKWTEWSVWEVRPAGYEALTGGAVTGLDNDVTTYQIGVGRRFNETFSGFARVTYEAESGGTASRLAPTDGATAFGIGGTYTMDQMKITGGIEYRMLGDAIDSDNEVIATSFSDNSAIGVGLSIGFNF